MYSGHKYQYGEYNGVEVFKDLYYIYVCLFQ